MRRRVRETFVLGAERLDDEAELDLRNEAETDHKPNAELDQTAPVEPAILLPEEAADSPAGAGVARSRAPGSSRVPRRPRPPLRALVVVGAIAGVTVLVLGRSEDGPPVAPSGAVSRPPAVSTEAAEKRAPAQERHNGQVRAEARRPLQGSAGSSRAPSRRDPERAAEAAAPSAPPAVGRESEPQTPELGLTAPVAQALAPMSSSPGSSGPSGPVQSAASVRREFGP